MATAASLQQAAGQAFDNLYALWVVGNNSLKNALAAYAAALLPVFPEDDQVGRPIVDWLVLIYALEDNMVTVSMTIPPTTIDYQQLTTAADYVYRMCWLASRPTTGSPQITTAQQTAILAAYNANF